MRRLLLLIAYFYFGLQILSAQKTEKLVTKDFCIQVEDFEGAYHYPNGLRYKLGMFPHVEGNTEWHYWNFGLIEGKETTSADFEILSVSKNSEKTDIETLTINIRHKVLPLQAKIILAAYGKTGVITSAVELINLSDSFPIRFSKTPSFTLALPPSDYNYSYLTSGWANERKIQTRALTEGKEIFRSETGRSSEVRSPWLNIHDKNKNIYYTAQLAWSGNWFKEISKSEENTQATMGEIFDNDQLILLPSCSVKLAEVAFSGGYGSLDTPANNLHRYQRQYLLKEQKSNNPMLLQFNTWFPLQIDINSTNLKPYIDEAADLGLEVFIIDSGWFVKNSYEKEVGSWNTSSSKFPNGLCEIADYTRSKGLKFGLWFEIESLGEDSDILKEHPEWCLQYGGLPVISEPWSRRRHLDFSNPDVFDWAVKQFDDKYKECGGIDWVKLDYNISIGNQFQNTNGIATGDCLRNHIQAYYRWLNVLSEKYPSLILENCSSGALRMDLGILKHTHTSFVSDETSPNPSLGMAWSSTLEYMPCMVNHWIVGMQNHLPIIDESLPKEYWDHMFRVPMNGQFGISSRILDWSPQLKACAKENIHLYKKIRTIVADADCYHLTPQPDYNNPEGWTAIAYVSEDKRQAVATIFRGKGGDDSFNLKLGALNPSHRYAVSVDGKEFGIYSGNSLAKGDLKIKLDTNRSAVVLLQKK